MANTHPDQRRPAIAIIGLAALCGCSAPSDTATSGADKIYPWPFTVQSVTLACRQPAGRGVGMVTVQADGTEYGVNGLSRRAYPKVDAVWLDNPAIEGTKIPIGTVIDKGLALCLDQGRAAPDVVLEPGVAPAPPPPAPTVAPPPSLIDESKLSIQILDAKVSGGAVTGEISTNIPLPVELMLSASLHGQGPKDTYIGTDLKVRVDTNPQVFSLPLKSDGEPLPSGRYDLEATFYPRWSGDVGPPEAKGIKREITAVRAIVIGGSGETADQAIAKKEAQRWVMETVTMDYPWDQAAFEKRLGPATKHAVTNRNSLIVAYYFKRADMTIFVNTYYGQVSTWRVGFQSEE